jgi:hypothetical protein
MRRLGPHDANWQFREQSEPVGPWVLVLLAALTALWVYAAPPM